MRKNFLVIPLLTLCLLTGCGRGNAGVGRQIQDIKPDLVKIGEGGCNIMTAYYIVDRNTNVVYIAVSADRGIALTAALDKNGKPLKTDELGIEVK